MSGKFWDKAWSLVEGCTPVSAGCDNCWLAALANRFAREVEPGHSSGILTDEAGVFNGTVIFRSDRLDLPMRTKKPTVFAVWSDLYHEAVTDEQIASAFRVMWRARQHTFLIVTKRAKRAAAFGDSDYMVNEEGNPCSHTLNVYHLVTVENQEMADKRIPYALQIPGKVGLLIEPMLGPVDLRAIGGRSNGVLLGGETGPNARPMHPDWARSVRNQCEAAGVPFFFKSWGRWYPDSKEHTGSMHQILMNDAVLTDYDWMRQSGRLLDGREHNDLPWRRS